MRQVSFWLWAIAGVLLGLGSLFSTWLWSLVGRVEKASITGTPNGWPLLVLGLLLAAALAWRTRGRGAWAGLLGLGLIPALLLASSFFILLHPSNPMLISFWVHSARPMQCSLFRTTLV
jgi:hypothetical protein